MLRVAPFAALVVALALFAAPAAAQQVLAAQTLRAGTVLGESDLMPAADAAGSQARAALIGMQTRRAVYAGRPVTPADVGPPVLVERNAVVVMHYQDGALGIRTEGRALEPGGAGETVRVLNLASRQPVHAVVIGPNLVEVRR